MAEVNWKERFAASKIFSSLSDVEIERILSSEVSEECRYTAGDEIINQGERGHNCFFVGRGSVSIQMPGPAGDRVNLAVLTHGEFFGEMSLLHQQPRSANVTAREDSVVLRVKAAKLREILNQRPDVMSQIYIDLAEKLRDLAARVINVSYNEVDNKMELFSAKLDAELTAMNSTLAASQTVFEQTTTRANEVITSTERQWKSMTLLGSIAAGALSLLVAGFGWFGFKTYNDFSTHLDNMQQSLKDRSDLLDVSISDVENKAAEAKKIHDRLQIELSTVQAGAAYSMFPIIERITTGSPETVELLLPTLKDNLLLIAKDGKRDNITIVYKEIWRWFFSINTRQDVKFVARFREQFNEAMRGVTDEKVLDLAPRARMLAYYFRAANQAFLGDADIFHATLEKMRAFQEELDREVLFREDEENFSPVSGFSAIFAINPSVGDETIVRPRLESAWRVASS